MPDIIVRSVDALKEAVLPMRLSHPTNLLTKGFQSSRRKSLSVCVTQPSRMNMYGYHFLLLHTMAQDYHPQNNVGV